MKMGKLAAMSPKMAKILGAKQEAETSPYLQADQNSQTGRDSRSREDNRNSAFTEDIPIPWVPEVLVFVPIQPEAWNAYRNEHFASDLSVFVISCAENEIISGVQQGTFPTTVQEELTA